MFFFSCDIVKEFVYRISRVVQEFVFPCDVQKIVKEFVYLAEIDIFYGCLIKSTVY